MNIYKWIVKGTLLLSAVAALSSCDDNAPVKGGELIDQRAALEVFVKDKAEQTNPFIIRSMEVSDADVEVVTLNVRARLTLGAAEETPITVSVDNEAAKQYGKGEINLLPASVFAIANKDVTIPKGSVVSNPTEVTIRLTDAVEYDVLYTFALRLNPIRGASLNSLRDVAVFTLLRSEDKVVINEVVRIDRSVYFQPRQDFDHSGDFTMECLVNVSKFRDAADAGDAQISTLMGIEGGTLMRFGDAGLDGNKLQVAGQNINDFIFDTDKWYHIAMTYVAETTTVTLYIDGKQKAEFSTYSSIVPTGDKWMIGRSYNGNRGLEAMLSEVRVWKTARTQSEIEENMLTVDPADGNLIAYWKMNEAEGNKVVDITGNGYDLILKNQSNQTEAEKVSVKTLDEPIEGVEK